MKVRMGGGVWDGGAGGGGRPPFLLLRTGGEVVCRVWGSGGGKR